MKTTPFRFLLWALLFVAITVLIWPFWGVVLVFLDRLSWIFLLLIFLAICAFFISRFIRQLDAVEGPFPRTRAKDLSGQEEAED